LANDVSCLAVHNPPQKILKVVSTKKNGGLSKTFVFDVISPTSDANGSGNVVSISRRDHSLSRGLRKVQAALRSTFLPSGYPAKTPPGYLKYSVWSWIQDISTQLRSVLATQRVLEGVGVGREGASALSALMNFLVRDGCGMVATLIFTSTSASRFRSDIKRWRIFADIMVDVGITLEVAATQVPRVFFLPMISVGTMCKAICGVAAGATGGAINLHWARGSDISDINAKFGAQHTVTGALGLIFAAFFARSVSTLNQIKLWILYSILTLLHIVANMQCMKLIAFDSFNNARMNLILDEYLTQLEAEPMDTPTMSDMNNGTLSSKSISLSKPEDISKVEPLFFVSVRPPRRRKVAPLLPIRFGVSLDEFSTKTSRKCSELENLLNQASQSDKYLIAASLSQGGKTPPTIVVSFLSHASPEDHAKAYYHAVLLSRQLVGINDLSDHDIINAETIVNDQVHRSWDGFTYACHTAGWDLSKTELQSQGYELEMIS
jgi:hypothetical protein